MITSHSGSAIEESNPLVAVCMTTYNPPPELFTRQIQSISDQSYKQWVCIISDDGSSPEVLHHIQSTIAGDKRFVLHQQQERLGFYRNFERCLRLAPAEAKLIALSDHDDRWHSDKLESLVSALKDGVALVYSDMNIVDAEGRLLSNTYWTNRPNNYTNFASLLMANTVTGAASLFPKWLLDYALPFPERIGDGYHDHWIACIALAIGKIEYIDRPLYDYVQHQSNVIGHVAPEREKLVKKFFKLPRKPRGLRHIIARAISRWFTVSRWRPIYFSNLIRTQLTAQVIEMRCGEQLQEEKRKILRRIARLDDSLLSQMWLTWRVLKNIGRTSETIGTENYLMKAVIWKKYIRLKSLIPIGGQPE
jgi:glycosyltransferase involved in cell wall biosynthesis